MPTSKKDLTIFGFEVAIKENLDDLKSKYEKYFPDRLFSSITEEHQIFKTRLTDSLIATRMEEFFKDPATYSSNPFLLSYQLTKAAIHYNEKRNMEKAWFLLSKARYFAGIADASLFDTEKFLYEVVNANNLKGARARSQKSSAAKRRAAELIREKAEQHKEKSRGTWKGWEKPDEAISDIVDELRSFIATNVIKLNPHILPKRVSDWMGGTKPEDVEIRNAFNETCAEGAEYIPQKRRSWDEGIEVAE